jgi:hypothetical protein
MRRLVLVSALVFLVAACSTQPTSASRPSPTTAARAVSPQAGATTVAGGCGSTPLLSGGFPTWLEPTVRDLNNMSDVPYAVSSNSTAAAFVLAYPLKANVSHAKILWVIASPRQGLPLNIQTHPTSSTAPLVTESVPAGASPGEIYPDGASIPSAGCWHFTLRWATGQAELDLLYG